MPDPTKNDVVQTKGEPNDLSINVDAVSPSSCEETHATNEGFAEIEEFVFQFADIEVHAPSPSGSARQKNA